ncbi:MAG: elongation factor Tu [Acidobacteriota bacterium]|jgi:hypothetical protein|nr:elongation factor Tu [Acidobacteriota bacterium]
MLHLFSGVPAGSLLELRLIVSEASGIAASARVVSENQTERVFTHTQLVQGIRIPIELENLSVAVLLTFQRMATAELIARVLRSDGSIHASPWIQRFLAQERESALATVRVIPAKSRSLDWESITRDKLAVDVEVPRPRRRKVLASQPSARRYVNAALFDVTKNRLTPSMPLAAGQVFRLRLDIGPLSAESQLERPEPFPDRAVPRDVWLDVMLASSHFAVGAKGSELGKAPVAHGRMFLPGDGSPARTATGSPYLYFFLRAPQDTQLAVARVGFYYRNALLQSLRLATRTGESGDGFSLTVDYTISESLADLHLIPERPRLSVVTNDNGDGRHQITVRSVRGGDPGPSTSFELDDETIGGVISQMRSVLRSEAVAPTRRKRSRNQLVEDLRRLAPWGWQLHAALAGQFLAAWNTVRENPEELVIHISRPTNASFTLPWSLLYEIQLDSDYLDSEMNVRKLRICDVVNQWDERSPLFEGLPRQCPLAGEPWHRENVLCPFGFWGYRYSVEQLSSTDRPVTLIAPETSPHMAVGLTQYDVDASALEKHLNKLRQLLLERFPQARVEEGKSKKEIRALLGQDLALVYFYCHGERPRAKDPKTYLGVGRSERITPEDVIGWIQGWLQDGRVVWDRVRPLIFINACHSAEINPDTLITYLNAFIGTAKAAGVIGTEVKVYQPLAMELAAEFFQLFMRQGYTVERSLREVRLSFLADGNLFGLVYTPYCWADLQLTR